jgi:hypothetical protein
MKSQFVVEKSGLVPIDHMFSGFKCMNIVKHNYDYFNGFRITMRRPIYPCKFGIYMQTNLKEYEHYVGHILDTGPSSPEFVEYEIPVKLMVHDLITAKLVQA